MKKISAILFDMDGVLFDSKKNMKKSWNDTNKKFNLNINFEKYFSKIGIPFNCILDQLKIKKNNNKIKNFYKKKSILYKNLVKLYPHAKKTLNYLTKKKIKIGVVTSKDKFRTLQLIKRYNLNFSTIVCPSKNLRGKPYPDQILLALKKIKVSKKNAVYIGDTYIDLLAAKRSGVKFIFAKYGYGKIIDKKIVNIKNLSELKKIY